MKPAKVCFEFQDENSSTPVKLEYEIFDNAFARRWLGLLRHTLNKPHHFGDDFFGSILDDETTIVAGMRRCVEEINAFCGSKGFADCIIKIEPHLGMTQSFLNDLHGLFERLVEQDRFSVTGSAVKQALCDLNLFIHRAEKFAPGQSRDQAFHIEALPSPVQHARFHETDYDLFTPDWEYGGLYLTYGITGVPTVNAFLADATPRPQDRYTAGMFLAFYGTARFQDHEALADWLKSKHGIDAANPKAALGYIQLGRLVTPVTDHEKFAKSIAANRKITRVYLENVNDENAFLDAAAFVWPETSINTLASLAEPPLSPARWPFDSELFYHLDLVPYLDLEISFDAKALLEEAVHFQQRAVVHRTYDQDRSVNGGRWKSLALRALDGDAGKTLYHWEYGIQENPNYEMTELARLCPKTMELLDRITDVNQCERIRFMYLEPGAEINVHHDSDRDVSLAVNISLNMPSGCVFEAQLNSDGSKNPHSTDLPFRDSGSVLLFNNSKYHRVYNHSDTCRMHLIFHGPIRFSDEHLLQLARRQNGTCDRADLVRRLISKKIALQEEIGSTSDLYQNWVTLGLKPDSLDASIGLVIVDNRGSDPALMKWALENVTMASLFPLIYDVCGIGALTEHAEKLYAAGKRHVVFIGAGSFISDMSRFVVELTRTTMNLVRENRPLCGHIMDFPEADKVPYLHEQFCIIDLLRWREAGWIPLGGLFSQERISFPGFLSSPEKFHDAYTPHWIEPSPTAEIKSGNANWGSALMAGFLSRGWRTANVPEELRALKKYAYPLDGRGPQSNEVRASLESSLKLTADQVFVFNNEPLTILQVPNFAPTQLISVAAGFKPARLIDQYWTAKKDEPTCVTFLDFSRNALDYMNALNGSQRLDGVLTRVVAFSKKFGMGLSSEHARSLLSSEVLPHFNNGEESLMRALRLLNRAESVQADFVDDPMTLVTQIKTGERPLIWISNAFYNRSLYFVTNQEDSQTRLRRLYRLIAEKLNTRCWSLGSNANTALFGESPALPIGLVTDGCLFRMPEAAREILP